jgi:hypothetical protein
MTVYEGAVRIQSKDGRDLQACDLVGGHFLAGDGSGGAGDFDLPGEMGDSMALDQSGTLVPAPSASARS